MKKIVFFSTLGLALTLLLGAAAFRVSAVTVTPPSNVTAVNTTDKKAIEVKWKWDYEMPEGFELARFYI